MDDKTKKTLLKILVPVAVVVMLLIGGCAGYCIHMMSEIISETETATTTTTTTAGQNNNTNSSEKEGNDSVLPPLHYHKLPSLPVGSPIEQIRNANVGDLIFPTSDPTVTWRVLARDSGKVLMYETFESRKPDHTYNVSDVKSDTYWTIDAYTTNYYFTDRDFTKYFVKPGTFIPDADLYTSYIRHSNDFVSDGYPWVIKQGNRRRFEGDDRDYYNMRYIGIDDMLNGDKGDGKFVFRVFVWVDVSD